MIPTADALSTVLVALASLGIASTIYIVVDRLYFSPIFKFPGSMVAAVTHWYDFYHDYWRNRKYIFEIEKMHKRYGPIVRVNPYELSIYDAEFYNKIYITESTPMPVEEYIVLTQLGSHLLTQDHNLHRKRRKPLDPFFSRM
ncbi:hypothetical protein DM02DRAFT_534697 [Periconia macrospinosa]|uniref:Cytochrome P450 n=1 Tax=Periconia macrospinosa TaxID=97972 RepID=A0A2V1DF73_9PLEO|nr:hypothetical protein DM02DRAFT_534697 [Periconia macrospinosa]